MIEVGRERKKDDDDNLELKWLDFVGGATFVIGAVAVGLSDERFYYYIGKK